MHPVIIQIPTNLNNKMACPCFVHIDLAPASPLPESKVKNTVVEIQAKDGSHPPVQVVLVDLCRTQLGRINCVATLPSHGMDYADFCAWFMRERPGANSETLVAIYYYKKI